VAASHTDIATARKPKENVLLFTSNEGLAATKTAQKFWKPQIVEQ